MVPDEWSDCINSTRASPWIINNSFSTNNHKIINSLYSLYTWSCTLLKYRSSSSAEGDPSVTTAVTASAARRSSSSVTTKGSGSFSSHISETKGKRDFHSLILMNGVIFIPFNTCITPPPLAGQTKKKKKTCSTPSLLATADLRLISFSAWLELHEWILPHNTLPITRKKHSHVLHVVMQMIRRVSLQQYMTTHTPALHDMYMVHWVQVPVVLPPYTLTQLTLLTLLKTITHYTTQASKL